MVKRGERNPLSIGDVYGRLTVVAPKDKGDAYRYYECICSCGNTIYPRKDTLTNGQSSSCGCYAAERAGDRLRTHGLSTHPLASIHYGMIRRCYNPERKDYIHYGGRGISVCDRWRDAETGLESFIADMYQSFEPGLEIERKDNDGNYCLDNCKWATRSEQVLNRRLDADSIGVPNYITYEGRTLCLAQWERVTGIPSACLSDRLGKLGWSVEKSLTFPMRVGKNTLVLNCGLEFGLNDIFKVPPNASATYKKLGMTAREYLYNLYGHIGTVKYYVGKRWYMMDSTVERVPVRLVSATTENFTNTLAKLGVQH